MQTRKLHQAHLKLVRLAKFLEVRGWETGDLTGITDRADDKIIKIVDEAVEVVIGKLQGESYLGEAETWAKNEMTDGRKPITLSAPEVRKAKTEVKRIKKIIRELEAL